MKRFCLISSAAAASLFTLAPVANAEPAILYIPTEEITLSPSGIVDTPCEFVSTSEDNPGAGCVGGLAEETMRAPHPMADTLTTDVAMAVDAFDVHVTNTRPPAYVPHYMLMPGTEDSMESTSYSCTGSSFACASRGRNGVAFTNTGTMNCMMMPDLLQQALYSFGTMSGLEGSVNPDDPMHYPPTWMSTGAYQDQCDSISPLIDPDTMMPGQPACTSADHNGECAMGEQNTVADLTAYFGARVEDMDPPVIMNSSPTDGMDFPDQSTVSFSVMIEDADPIVAVSWTITSPVFDEAYGGEYMICTNNHCDRNLLEGDPFRANEGPWESELGPLPGGTYEVLIEAADYHGNVADSLTITFTVNGGMGEESGSDTDMMTSGATMTSGASMTTFPPLDDSGTTDDSDTEGESTSPEMEDEGGCSCRQSSGAGGAFLMILGLFGFAATRRRD